MARSRAAFASWVSDGSERPSPLSRGHDLPPPRNGSGCELRTRQRTAFSSKSRSRLQRPGPALSPRQIQCSNIRQHVYTPTDHHNGQQHMVTWTMPRTLLIVLPGTKPSESRMMPYAIGTPTRCHTRARCARRRLPELCAQHSLHVRFTHATHAGPLFVNDRQEDMTAASARHVGAALTGRRLPSPVSTIPLRHPRTHLRPPHHPCTILARGKTDSHVFFPGTIVVCRLTCPRCRRSRRALHMYMYVHVHLHARDHVPLVPSLLSRPHMSSVPS